MGRSFRGTSTINSYALDCDQISGEGSHFHHRKGSYYSSQGNQQYFRASPSRKSIPESDLEFPYPKSELTVGQEPRQRLSGLPPPRMLYHCLWTETTSSPALSFQLSANNPPFADTLTQNCPRPSMPWLSLLNCEPLLTAISSKVKIIHIALTEIARLKWEADSPLHRRLVDWCGKKIRHQPLPWQFCFSSCTNYQLEGLDQSQQWSQLSDWAPHQVPPHFRPLPSWRYR